MYACGLDAQRAAARQLWHQAANGVVPALHDDHHLQRLQDGPALRRGRFRRTQRKLAADGVQLRGLGHRLPCQGLPRRQAGLLAPQALLLSLHLCSCASSRAGAMATST
jgi:hypothetical protein